MTNLPPTDPNSSRLGFDELIGIVIAFGTIGTILAVTLGSRDRGFHLNRLLNPEVENRTTDPSERVPPRPVPAPTASPEAATLPRRPQAETAPSPFPFPMTLLPAAPVPASPVAPIASPEAESRPFPTTILSATKPEDASPQASPQVSPSPPPVTFTDVPQDLWARPYIEALAARGILKGFPDGTFKPGGSITRAEFAALVQNAFDQQPKASAQTFKDVPANFWASPAIQETVKTGFLQGYPNNIFRPNQPITKAQVLVALANGLGLTPPTEPQEVLTTYQDANQIPNYARAPVSAATQAGIVSSYPNPNILNPRRNASRAEVAAIVYQAMAQAGKVEAISSEYLVKP